VGFIRDFGQRLVHSQECALCFEYWAPFSIGHKDGVREVYRRVQQRGGGEGEIGAALAELFGGMDANRDGFVSLQEKQAPARSLDPTLSVVFSFRLTLRKRSGCTKGHWTTKLAKKHRNGCRTMIGIRMDR
jgi:hypothetical protein